MAWKPILAAAAVTFLVAACGGNDTPPAGRGADGNASASDASSSDASDAEADAAPPSSDYIGQPAPSVSADDDHPQTQWKSKMFAGDDTRN